MPITMNHERAMLAESAAGLLARHWSTDAVRAARTPTGPGHDPRLWTALVDNEWLALTVPGWLGGADGSLRDLGVLLRAAGAALVPDTLSTTMAGVGLLVDSSADGRGDDLLGDVLAGNRLLTVVSDEPGVHDRPELLRTRARAVGAGWVIDGFKTSVPGIAGATTIVLTAVDDRGVVGLFCVPSETTGVRIRGHDGFSGGAMADVELIGVGVPETARLSVGDAWEAYRGARSVRAVMQAAGFCGGAQAVLSRTVDFLNQREQFGRPLAGFQALRHRIADLATRLTATDLAVDAALAALDEGDHRRRILDVAVVAAADAFTDATLLAHQFHGALGFAREHDLFLWSDAARACSDVEFARSALHESVAR